MKHKVFSYIKSLRDILNFNNLRMVKKYRLNKLRNRDFTIISNNCWGGMIYQRYGLKYNTPTVGLYFYAEDFIKFLLRLEYYLKLDPVIINLEESKYKEKLYILRKRHYFPIIKIDDIEIIFLHYKTDKEAIEKWNYRKKRIKMNNLLVKFNDQNMFTTDYLDIFNNLKYTNKIFFTGTDYQGRSIFVKQSKSSIIKNDMTYFKKPINMTEYLNKMV